MDLGSAVWKSHRHWLSLPCPVFLLLGNDRSVLALLVIPYGVDVFAHLLLNLCLPLEDLVGSCIHTALKGVVGFKCCQARTLS